MRDLKFRAWDKKERKWLLGYEFKNLGGFSMLGEVMMMGEYSSLLSSYFPDRSENIVLMQYTGLKDKDDKEIYEGDIVKVDFQGKKFFYNYVGEVEYSNGSFWCTKHNGYGGEKYTLNGLMNISLAPHTILNVIGNIYENSELLKS